MIVSKGTGIYLDEFCCREEHKGSPRRQVIFSPPEASHPWVSITELIGGDDEEVDCMVYLDDLEGICKIARERQDATTRERAE